MVVSDLNVIRIHTNFTNTIKQVIEFDLNSLSAPGTLQTLKRIWTDPDSFDTGVTTEQVTETAAARFSQIVHGLHARGEDPAATDHFIMQMVFCLFAEDIKLLPDRLFSEMVRADRHNPALFQQDAQELLEAMNSGGRVAYKTIPHVNGGLFATVQVPRITTEEITLLEEASALDWSSIEPAIFGTLFERSLDPAKRSQLGAHYTGRGDIERVVEPVVMAPLRRRWAEIRTRHEPDPIPDPMPNQDDRHPERTRRIPVRSTSKPSRSDTKRRNTMLRDIDGFLDELRAVRVLDPACGSGNFLYVALNHLLTLEKEVMTFRAINAGTALGLPGITPKQVMGIEINEYAQELAQVTIGIGYILWMVDNGFGWGSPVLAPLENIRLQDALLTKANGHVSETIWPEADFIIGNPPFLGSQRFRREFGDKYAESLFAVFGGRVANGADLCTYFFEKARSGVETGAANRVGLLAIQTIRNVRNREVLNRIKATGDIFVAWPDEPWTLEGASGRIAIIGFDDGTEQLRHLDGVPVEDISADLSSTLNVRTAVPLNENSGIAFEGMKKAGPFEIDKDRAQRWLSLPVNPNGRPNSDVIRPSPGLAAKRPRHPRPRRLGSLWLGRSRPHHRRRGHDPLAIAGAEWGAVRTPVTQVW